MPRTAPQCMPERPTSWTGAAHAGGSDQAPLGHRSGVGFAVPPHATSPALSLPSYLQSPLLSPPPRQPVRPQHVGGHPGISAPPADLHGGFNKMYGFMGNQEAMERKTSLKPFSGEPGDFGDWREHFMDHMFRVHSDWRATLEWLSKTPENITFSRLNVEVMGPFKENAGGLAVKLEQLLIDYMPAKIYRRRNQLVGSQTEKNNGFILWRRLHEDFKGSGEMVEFAGVDTLRLYPSCSKISEVTAHLDGWKELLDLYGDELMAAPKMLRAMVLNIIPKELKTEILKENGLVGASHQVIIDWCRARCLILQNEQMAELTRKNLARYAGRMSALSDATPAPLCGQCTEPPAMSDLEEFKTEMRATMKSMISAVAKAKARPTRKPSPGGDKPRGRSPARGARSDSPGRSQSRGRLPGWDNRCYHCGSHDHMREGCKAFTAMMAKENGSKPKKDWKPPKGYVSELGKARAAAKALKGKVSSLSSAEDTASDDGDSDSYSEVDVRQGRRFGVHALRPFRSVTHGTSWTQAQVGPPSSPAPINAVSSFHSLGDDSQEYSLDMISALNTWGARVNLKPTKTKSQSQVKIDKLLDREVRQVNGSRLPQSQRTVVVKDLKDVNKLPDRIAALPTDRKGISRTARKMSKIQLNADERLVMVDSGSFVHAIDADVELPGHSIEPPTEAARTQIGETACGGLLHNLGSVRVDFQADGEDAFVVFNHMKVKVPILSVRQLVKDHNRVAFEDDGGYIHNKSTGKRIRFFEYQGVYYMKMKLKTLQPSKQDMDFARPGNP